MSILFERTEQTYQVAVSGLQGLIDGLTDLAGGRLPGAEPQLTGRVLTS